MTTRRRKFSKCETCKYSLYLFVMVMLEIRNVCWIALLLLNWNDIVEDDCGCHCSSYHAAVLVLELIQALVHYCHSAIIP